MTVLPCPDAELALELARPSFASHREGAGQPDLVVLASATPALSSDLCRGLKLQRSTNLLPVILCSSQSASSHLQVAADIELPAPCSAAELSGAIDRAAALRLGWLRDETLCEVRFHLPSDTESMEAFLRLLGPWLTSAGLGAYPIQQVSLAVREIVANAIEWGHGGQRDRIVCVAARLDAEKITIRVRDSGAGFDPANLPHAARPGDPLSHLKVRAARHLRDGGFGILMASGLVDHLCYNDTGNEAQLLKYLPVRSFIRGQRSEVRGQKDKDFGTTPGRSAPALSDL